MSENSEEPLNLIQYSRHYATWEVKLFMQRKLEQTRIGRLNDEFDKVQNYLLLMVLRTFHKHQYCYTMKCCDFAYYRLGPTCSPFLYGDQHAWFFSRTKYTTTIQCNVCRINMRASISREKRQFNCLLPVSISVRVFQQLKHRQSNACSRCRRAMTFQIAIIATKLHTE